MAASLLTANIYKPADSHRFSTLHHTKHYDWQTILDSMAFESTPRKMPGEEIKCGPNVESYINREKLMQLLIFDMHISKNSRVSFKCVAVSQVKKC